MYIKMWFLYAQGKPSFNITLVWEDLKFLLVMDLANIEDNICLRHATIELSQTIDLHLLSNLEEAGRCFKEPMV